MPSREPSLSNAEASNEEALQLLENIQDSAVFYSGRQHGKHLDLLLHLSRYSNLLLTVIGPTGSGKTHLKQHLQEKLDSGVTAVSLNANQVSSAPKLLSSLEASLNLELPPRAEPAQYLEEIRNHTELLSEDGGSCLLLIDNAEALDQTALDVVLELATTRKDTRRPHLALFGREDLLKRLNDRANLPRFEAVGHHLPLEAFSEIEARGYLEHRCHSVGLEHLPLNDNQFRRVYKASNGWPGLLNQALIKELQEKGPSEETAAPVTPPPKKPAPKKKTKRNKTPLWPIIAGAAILAIMVVGFVYFGDLGNTQPSETGTQLISRSHELRQDAWEGPLGQSDEVLEELERQVEELPPIEDELSADMMDTPDTTPPPLPEGGQPDSPDDAPPEFTASETTEEVVTQPSEPEPEVVQEPEPTNGFQDDGFRQEAWLMERDPEHFTLQLLASSEESTVLNFIQSQSNPENFVYYRRDHAGSPWVVLYGDQESREAAEAARDNLPADLRNQQPWLRRFSGIQSDLENR